MDASTHAAPYLLVDNGSETEVFFSPRAEARNPFSSSANKDTSVNVNREAGNARRSIHRSCSDTILTTLTDTLTRSPSGWEREAQSHSADDQHRTEAQSPAQASLQALRPPAQRACSSSRVELRSCYHDASITSAALPREPMERTRHIGKRRPLFAEPSRRAAKAQSRTEESGLENAEPKVRGRSALRVISSQDLRNAFDQSKQHTLGAPLKPCLKKPAQSTTPTPPSGVNQAAKSLPFGRNLRRVKTVDFDEVTKPLLALPAVVANEKSAQLTDQTSMRTEIDTSQSKSSACYPGPRKIGKSGFADPAITRTDVHVIAMAPSWTADSDPLQDNVDPATPTMQIAESSNRRYEVIWDDVQDEHSIRTHRRSSSASQSLRAVNSTAAEGLQRAYFNHIDWSSKNFKPTIVVFPHDDGWRQDFDCAVEDDEDLHVLAPPNSQRASAGPSRVPSRPASTPVTRAASEEHFRLEEALQDIPSESRHRWWMMRMTREKSLEVPDPKVQPISLFVPS